MWLIYLVVILPHFRSLLFWDKEKNVYRLLSLFYIFGGVGSHLYHNSRHIHIASTIMGPPSQPYMTITVFILTISISAIIIIVLVNNIIFFFFFYFFGGLECVGHSFAYVAHLWFLRDVWIRTQSAAVASCRATDLATHPSLTEENNITRSTIITIWTMKVISTIIAISVIRAFSTLIAVQLWERRLNHHCHLNHHNLLNHHHHNLLSNIESSSIIAISTITAMSAIYLDMYFLAVSSVVATFVWFCSL